MMGLFSKQDPAGIMADAALGAENVRNKYDNIALAQKNKREAQARQRAEAEASEMAAQTRMAQEQVKAAEEEKDALKSELLDFKLAIDDVSNAINLPHLNLAWKVAQQTIRLYSSKIKLFKGIVLLERRYRQVYNDVLEVLERKYGIPHTEINMLLKQYYEKSCKNIADESIPKAIHEDKPDEYLFLDDKVKALDKLRLIGNQYVDDLSETEKSLAKLQQVHAIRNAEKKTNQNVPH